MSPAPLARGAHLLSPFNRPEYIPVPELLISALAWTEFETCSRPADGQWGLVYERVATGQGRVAIIETSPGLGGSQRVAFGEELRRAGLEHERDQALLASAVARGLRGIKAAGATGRAASPVSIGLALLQDMRGMTGKENPYALAKTLEQMGAMGAAPNEGDFSVASRWRRAAEARVEMDPLVRALDDAVRSHVKWGVQRRVNAPDAALPADWAGIFPNSPFPWFRETWALLTSDPWVRALPARLWVDWALAVLRLALGLGYLWEAAWYQRLTDLILDISTGAEPPSSWSEVEEGIQDPLPWAPAGGSVSLRSVTAILKPRVGTAHRVHGEIEKWLDHDSNRIAAEGAAVDAIVAMANDSALIERLTAACKPATADGKNAWEAIRFTLGTRSDSEGSIDYYGVLRAPSPRYLVVDPGIEWMAAMASLACGEPGQPATIRDVTDFLRRAGLRPQAADLLALLERTGLARGSADADQAVIVRPAF